MDIKYCLQSTDIVVLDKYKREKDNNNNKNTIVCQILACRSFDKSFWITTIVESTAIFSIS